MTNLPEVIVQWHGLNDYNQHDVAAQNTIKPIIDALPAGFEFSLPELRAHVEEAVRQDIATKPSPDDYNADLDAEVGGITFVASYWTTNPYRRREGWTNMLLEWVDEEAVLTGEIPEDAARYRRI